MAPLTVVRRDVTASHIASPGGLFSVVIICVLHVLGQGRCGIGRPIRRFAVGLDWRLRHRRRVLLCGCRSRAVDVVLGPAVRVTRARYEAVPRRFLVLIDGFGRVVRHWRVWSGQRRVHRAGARHTQRLASFVAYVLHDAVVIGIQVEVIVAGCVEVLRRGFLSDLRRDGRSLGWGHVPLAVCAGRTRARVAGDWRYGDGLGGHHGRNAREKRLGAFVGLRPYGVDTRRLLLLLVGQPGLGRVRVGRGMRRSGSD